MSTDTRCAPCSPSPHLGSFAARTGDRKRPGAGAPPLPLTTATTREPPIAGGNHHQPQPPAPAGAKGVPGRTADGAGNERQHGPRQGLIARALRRIGLDRNPMRRGTDPDRGDRTGCVAGGLPGCRSRSSPPTSATRSTSPACAPPGRRRRPGIVSRRLSSPRSPWPPGGSARSRPPGIRSGGPGRMDHLGPVRSSAPPTPRLAAP